MNYNVELSQKTVKILDKMQSKDKRNFEKIVDHLRNLEQNPDHFGKPLTGNLKGLWSYRVGAFRIIYQLQRESRVVFIVTVRYRRDVYD